MDLIVGHKTPIGQVIRENLDPLTTKYVNVASEIDHYKYNRVYVCSISRDRYKANTDPLYDMFILGKVFDKLKMIECEKIILISTVHVFNHFTIQNENVKRLSSETFGQNRFKLEENLRFIFNDQLLIVRLPEIFGIGLDKEDNVLFDMINTRRINKINNNTAFQWYPIAWLFSDISTALSYDLKTVNLFPEPIETLEIISSIFPRYKKKGYNGRRLSYNHKSEYERLYVFSPKSILSTMKNFVKMNEYILSENNMSVSNLAWDPVYDDHAIFLMKRYGIKNVQIMPTKYDTWESIFETPDFHLKYKINDINIDSLHYVLNGINEDIVDEPGMIAKHLKKVSLLCKKIGVTSIIIESGNRNIPQGMNLKMGENILSSVLESVQDYNKDVKICLQPSSKEYGCELGNTVESCYNMANGKFYVNFDTGNCATEKDCPRKYTCILNGSVSCSFMRPIHHLNYERFQMNGISKHISDIPISSKIALKFRSNDVTVLGEQFRRFSTFMAII